MNRKRRRPVRAKTLVNDLRDERDRFRRLSNHSISNKLSAYFYERSEMLREDVRTLLS